MTEVKSVTVDDVMSWGPCEKYSCEYVTELFAGRESVTALDILDMDIWDMDKLKAVLRPEFIKDKVLLLLACEFVERTLYLFNEAYPNSGRQPQKTMRIVRQWMAGRASQDQLTQAVADAWDTAQYAACSLSLSKTEAAARNAAFAVAEVAASIRAGRAAQYVVGRAAKITANAAFLGGWNEVRTWQVDRVCGALMVDRALQAICEARANDKE